MRSDERRTGFDITDAIRRTCQDMVQRLPELAHIDVGRIAFSFAQTRKASGYGTYATITPLRFEGGALFTMRGAARYTLERLFDRNGREMLYVLTVYLPRFMNTDFLEKLATLLHELWHIHPQFNGDLRRFPGRCYAHWPSQHAYDRQMYVLARRWLGLEPPHDTFHFLQFTFRQLSRIRGPVYGTRVPQRKLLKMRN